MHFLEFHICCVEFPFQVLFSSSEPSLERILPIPPCRAPRPAPPAAVGAADPLPVKEPRKPDSKAHKADKGEKSSQRKLSKPPSCESGVRQRFTTSHWHSLKDNNGGHLDI